MKMAALAIAVLAIAVQTGSAIRQSHEGGISVQLPGSALKWIHIAEKEFERQKLDVSKYDVTVTEENDTVSVSLTNPHRPQGIRGNPGPLPEFTVDISKSNAELIRRRYVR
jgi:hypothetical protein